eukprot:1801683-Rhodomonas_salina.2
MLQWDTGEIARAIAFGNGVVVDYNGVRVLPKWVFPKVSGFYSADYFDCFEWDEAFCHSPQNFSVVFPAKSHEIIVRMNADHSHGFPSVLNNIIPQTCTATGNGIGRGVFDLPRYDLSACDVESMVKSFFLFHDKLYFIPLPFPPWLHFLLCVSAIFTLSAVLYVLKPRALTDDKESTLLFSSKTLYTRSNVKISAEQLTSYAQTMDYVYVNALVTFILCISSQVYSDTFLTHEDRWAFAIGVVTFLFYFILGVTI